MTVYDCFTFCDELDTLEIRLATLDPVVDVFVLVESPTTFAGKKKPLNYEKNAARFKAWAGKIRHVVAELPKGDDRWQCEHVSRDAAMKGMTDAQPGDWVCFGDVDEIPHPSHIAARKAGVVRNQAYRYYWNMASNEQMLNTTCMTFGELVQRGGFAKVRREDRWNLQIYENGWHFSTMGDPVEHLKTRTHAEYDAPEFHAMAKAGRAELKDIIGRPISLWPVGVQNLPMYLQQNADRFGKGLYAR